MGKNNAITLLDRLRLNIRMNMDIFEEDKKHLLELLDLVYDQLKEVKDDWRQLHW